MDRNYPRDGGWGLVEKCSRQRKQDVQKPRREGVEHLRSLWHTHSFDECVADDHYVLTV